MYSRGINNLYKILYLGVYRLISLYEKCHARSSSSRSQLKLGQSRSRAYNYVNRRMLNPLVPMGLELESVQPGSGWGWGRGYAQSSSAKCWSFLPLKSLTFSKTSGHSWVAGGGRRRTRRDSRWSWGRGTYKVHWYCCCCSARGNVLCGRWAARQGDGLRGGERIRWRCSRTMQMLMNITDSETVTSTLLRWEPI